MMSPISGAGPTGAIQDVRSIERPRPSLLGAGAGLASPASGSDAPPPAAGSPRGSLLNLVV